MRSEATARERNRAGRGSDERHNPGSALTCAATKPIPVQTPQSLSSFQPGLTPSPYLLWKMPKNLHSSPGPRAHGSGQAIYLRH